MKASGEKVTSIAIDQIQPFPNHPFQSERSANDVSADSKYRTKQNWSNCLQRRTTKINAPRNGNGAVDLTAPHIIPKLSL